MLHRLSSSLLRAPLGSSHSALGWAVVFSVVVHLSLIAVSFRPSDLPRVSLLAPQLELVLVNAQTADAPLKAQVLAQVHLNGGGRADAGRATTLLPPSLWSRSGDALEETKSQLSQLEDQQTLLLARVKRQLNEMQARDQHPSNDHTHAQAREEQRQAMVRLIAQIERRIEVESARPKRLFAQVAAQQSAAALYFDHMRQVLEAQGTRQFPTQAGRRLYGELIVEMTVHSSGKVMHVKVLQTSGQPSLDTQATRLARQQRFGAFDSALRQQADQLVVVSTFRFLRDNRMVTEMGGKQ